MLSGPELGGRTVTAAQLFDPDPPIGRADARAVPLADNAAAATVTSPPYWGLRDYRAGPDELGRGTLDEYVADMVAVGRDVARYQRPDGTWWLNLGDTYAGAGGDYQEGGRKTGRNRYRQGDSGLPGPQQLLVPHRVALALQADGWLLRKTIVWDKCGVRPEDPAYVRRPFDAHEFVFMLVRSPGYRYWPQRFPEGWGDVWRIPPSWGVNHEAPMPIELANRCIRLSTSRPLVDHPVPAPLHVRWPPTAIRPHPPRQGQDHDTRRR